MKRLLSAVAISLCLSANAFSIGVSELCFSRVSNNAVKAMGLNYGDVSPEDVEFMIEHNMLKMSCMERDELTRNFYAMSIFLSGMSFAALACPEPFVTKGTATLMAFGSMTIGAVSFYISGMECTPGIKFLSPTQKEQVVKAICKELGKEFADFPEPHCLGEW